MHLDNKETSLPEFLDFVLLSLPNTNLLTFWFPHVDPCLVMETQKAKQHLLGSVAQLSVGIMPPVWTLFGQSTPSEVRHSRVRGTD